MTIKKHLFDYGTISDDHKEAAAEIAKVLEESGLSEPARQIKARFKVEELPTYNMEDSEFAKYCKMAGIFISMQGLIMEGEGADVMQYQLCAVNDDIRRLNHLIEVIKDDLQKS